MKNKENHTKGLVFISMKKGKPSALLPIAVFLVFYLGLGIYSEYILKIPMGFYNIPIVVAFLAAILVACLQNRSVPFEEKLALMGQGIGDKNIITMLLIFLAAGTFVGVVGRSSAESVAYFMLSWIPAKYAVAVLFVVACFVSTAMGTSVGTITLLVPIAAAVAETSGFSLALCVASVMGGSMFGDNLSFISDTTIAACNGQGCEMKDKFRENFWIALPAALAALALILVISFRQAPGTPIVHEYHLLQTVPYLLVLIGGIAGIQVFVVLLIGIASGAVIMLGTGQTTLWDMLSSMGSGTSGMFGCDSCRCDVRTDPGKRRLYCPASCHSQNLPRKKGRPARCRHSRRAARHCDRKQHRRDRHGKPDRKADVRGLRHHPTENGIAPRYLLLHLTGHPAVRRADARGDFRGA